LALFFEHESIRRALVSAGLLPANQVVDSSANTRPVFFAWSSKEVLLLQPANAWLSLEEVVFVRLPQTHVLTQQYLDQSAQPVVESEELKRLRTPLGQWRWAIAEFSKISTAGAIRIAASELERFAGKHWPGWYENILSNLDISKGATPTEPRLAKYAHRVAALNAVTPLIDWATNKSKSNHIHTLAEVLAYSKQDLFDLQKIRDLRLDLDWLKLLANDCTETESALAIVNEFESSPWSELQESLHSVTQAVSELNSLDHFSNDHSLNQAHLAIEQLTRGLTKMAHLRNAVKDSPAT
jgi:hypothetical protein